MTAKARIAIAVACAVLAVVASHAYAQEARRKEAQLRQETLDRYGGEVVQLAVATRRLEAGATIAASDVALKEWVSELAPEGALQDLDELVGKTLSSAVAEGQVLTDLAVSSSASSLEIPSGTVAVSLALNDKLGLVSGVDAGSRVFAYRVDDGGTQLVSGKVTVVSLNSEGGALSSSKSVTVAAKPEDIPALLEAAAQGTLRLVLPASNVSAASAGVAAAPSVVEPELDDEADAESDPDAETDPDPDPDPDPDTDPDADPDTDPDAAEGPASPSSAAPRTENKNDSKTDMTSELLEGDEDGR